MIFENQLCPGLKGSRFSATPLWDKGQKVAG